MNAIIVLDDHILCMRLKYVASYMVGVVDGGVPTRVHVKHTILWESGVHHFNCKFGGSGS